MSRVQTHRVHIQLTLSADEYTYWQSVPVGERYKPFRELLKKLSGEYHGSK